MKKKSATIVGAGLVGSLWAIFLAKRGYEIQVFERRPDMRRAGYFGGRSINLAMSHRGWTAIEKAGVRAEIEQHAIPMPGRMMHSVAGELTYQPYGKSGEAIYSVSRGGLNLALMNLAAGMPNVEFFFNERCLDVDLNEPKITFENNETGQKTLIESDLIFGTDGAFSAVRGAMQKTDRFDFSQKYLAHGYKELHIPAAAAGGFLMEKNALHIWPRGDFMLIALANADGSFTCTLFLPFEGPVSFSKLTDDASVLAFFEKYFPDALALMPTFLTDFNKNPTSSLVTINCSPWQWQGRISLLGDAAHAIVPFYGQGMNAGFEDCTVLDAILDEMGENWAEVLPEFSRRRKPNGDGIAELAQRNFVEMRDLVGDPKFILRKKIAARLAEKFPGEFLPVYSMVTFSDTPYETALREDDAQNGLFARILSLKDIENQWDSAEVEVVFKNWLAERRAV